MKCYICRTRLGEGHEATALAVGLGDETKELGGFLLCGKCTSALMRAWIVMHQIVHEMANRVEPTKGVAR